MPKRNDNKLCQPEDRKARIILLIFLEGYFLVKPTASEENGEIA
jgi:hypothetical protein